MDENTVFMFEDGETEIRKDLMYFSALFIRDFAQEGKIKVERKNCSDYRFFFQFLQSGEVPNDPMEQKNVFYLLVEWEFHFTYQDSFLWNISEKKIPIKFLIFNDWGCSDTVDNLINQVKSEFDHTIIHNGHQYPVNLKTFSSLSRYFYSQIQSSPDTVVSVIDEFSEETFTLFLECLHGIKSFPQDGKLVEIYILSQIWECTSLNGLIDTKSTSFILSALLKGDLIDQKLVEENATQQIHALIQDPLFYQLPLSTLSRVVSKSSIHEIIDNLVFFIRNLFETHGIESSFLIFSLDFGCCTEATVLGILETISIHSHSSLFMFLKKKFEEKENELKKANTEAQRRIEELSQQMKKEITKTRKRKKQKYQKRIEELHLKMKKEKAEDQQIIEELMKRIAELEKYQQERKEIEEEQRKRDEQEKKKRDEEQSKQNEQERKKREEEQRKRVYDGIVNGQWKLTKAPDFEGNIFEAATKGKLTSIIYLLANGTEVNSKTGDAEFWYLVGLLFIMLLKMVILMLLNILLIKKLVLI